ncbi:hypothetical protein HHI36_010000, partial [Cryptolaemus montrouzieri]
VSGMLHNTGQSLVFRVDKDTKHLVNISGGPLAYRYQFEEIYIHYGIENRLGSEHQIYGYTFPAEQNSAQNLELHTALRLATRANRTSPFISLCRETVEMSLWLRLKSLQITYAARVGADTENLVRTMLYRDRYSKLYRETPKLKSPLYYMVNNTRLESKLSNTMVYDTTRDAPWIYGHLNCDISLVEKIQIDYDSNQNSTNIEA